MNQGVYIQYLAHAYSGMFEKLFLLKLGSKSLTEFNENCWKVFFVMNNNYWLYNSYLVKKYIHNIFSHSITGDHGSPLPYFSCLLSAEINPTSILFMFAVLWNY